MNQMFEQIIHFLARRSGRLWRRMVAREIIQRKPLKDTGVVHPDRLLEPWAQSMIQNSPSRECSPETLIRARASVESAIAGEAAIAREPDDLTALWQALTQMESASVTEEQHETADKEFHLGILKATHNPVMQNLECLIVDIIRHKDPESLVASRKLPRIINLEHQAVYSAIERQDAHEARRLMYQHIINQLDQFPP